MKTGHMAKIGSRRSRVCRASYLYFSSGHAALEPDLSGCVGRAARYLMQPQNRGEAASRKEGSPGPWFYAGGPCRCGLGAGL